MTQREMFDATFKRPRNYLNLSEIEQWEIDKSLGILDWNGQDLSPEDLQRYKEHYVTPSAFELRYKDVNISNGGGNIISILKNIDKHLGRIADHVNSDEKDDKINELEEELEEMKEKFRNLPKR